ncbi:hypothetical protein QY97_02591 [Bacillus thermotolerans]|uniref:Uncharacterized protein n=1 Tax=Bacillus thermotolerans TaxID=1221996 RepID=A0A0F5I1E1_BACTR|nr:hypothetical protein QY97_02591 [Bacillus thermotolerans]KKB37313.1 hypothetical protein QY96_03230 [Bacillus thermotolerans]KKB39075.1 hypothetical protein QY95_02515 [Bacillus thermotolerans]
MISTLFSIISGFLSFIQLGGKGEESANKNAKEELAVNFSER